MKQSPEINVGPSGEEENVFRLQEEKKALRRIGRAETGTFGADIAKREVERIAHETKGFIGRSGGLSKAKERFRSDQKIAEEEALRNNLGINEDAVLKSLGDAAPAYQEIDELSDKYDDIREFEMRRMLELQRSSPHVRDGLERLLKTIRAEKGTLREKLEEQASEEPLLFRAHELVKFKEGLSEEGHIAHTESVEETLEAIGRNMLIGKPMFLHGPTGTGKTSLARLAAKHFTGKSPEMVYCSPQTRESSVWGKTGIRPTKEGQIETVDIYGPLAKAMRDGTVVIFDEFSALPKEQMVFIKGIFNAKPGDEVNVVGNGKIRISEGFQMIFTANLKSEKNPERQELPPEVAREFEQNNLEIGYQPKDESYDIILARLMNPDGSVDLSWHDLNETLPKLCEAMTEIQEAYAGVMRKETADATQMLGASGKVPGLKKFVMTQGTIEAILADWRVQKEMGGEEVSFVEHLDSRLKRGLTFKEYSQEDRALAAKILASKGLLRMLSPKDLGLPADIFDFEAAKKLRGDKKKIEALVADSRREAHVSLAELAELDPFKKRKVSSRTKVSKFRAEAERKLEEQRERDGLIQSILRNKRRIEGGPQVADSFSATYHRPEKDGTTKPEVITLDLESSVSSFTSFYQTHNLDLPPDFKERMEDIWNRNRSAMEQAIAEKGFDTILLVPGGTSLPDVHKKMTEGYNATYEGVTISSITEDTTHDRIILLHSSPELTDHPELEKTLKNVPAKDFIAQGERLTLTEYLILQRKFFDETGKHLDETKWTWIPGSKSDAHVVVARRYPDVGQLGVDAVVASYSDPRWGCRLSRCFV